MQGLFFFTIINNLCHFFARQYRSDMRRWGWWGPIFHRDLFFDAWRRKKMSATNNNEKKIFYHILRTESLLAFGCSWPVAEFATGVPVETRRTYLDLELAEDAAIVGTAIWTIGTGRAGITGFGHQVFGCWYLSRRPANHEICAICCFLMVFASVEKNSKILNWFFWFLKRFQTQFFTFGHYMGNS